MRNGARAVREVTAPASVQQQEGWRIDDETLSYEDQLAAARRASERLGLASVEDELALRLSTEEILSNNRFGRAPFLMDRRGGIERYPQTYTIEGVSYRAVRELGRGGFGLVLEVVPSDEPSVAHAGESAGVSRVLKLIPYHPSGEHHNELLQGLLSQEIDANDFEGSFVSGKSYLLPNGTRIYAVLLEKGEGATMDAIQEDEPELFHTPYGQVLLAQAAGALVRQLRAMKRRGWTHRDVKMENVIIDRQHPERSRLIDHGISSPEERRRDVREGAMIVTPLYVPSEVLRQRGDDLQMRDLYALALSIGTAMGVFRINESASGEILARAARAGAPAHIEDLLQLDGAEGESMLRALFAAPAMRELARLVYDTVRPHDTERERLTLWRDKGMRPEAIGRRIESLASEMEHWYKAKVILDAAEDNEGMFPRWQVRRLRKAFDVYDVSSSETEQTHAYMELVHTMEDLGFQDALRKHPAAIQDAWRKGIEAEKAAYERRGERREEEEAVHAAAHIRRRQRRRSVWPA